MEEYLGTYRKGYTDIIQFNNETCKLDPLVYSDHAELILNTKYGNISSWNISNPYHHHYFNSFETASFAKTHMCASINSDFLKNKIEDQINYIVEQLKERIPIQIIIEGYDSFYEKLKNKLNETNINYYLLYDETNEDPQNTVGILVNLNYFSVINSIIYEETYREEGDRITNYLPEKRISTAKIPIIYLGTYDNKILIVGGVHVRGSNSKFPISGINIYNNLINDLIDQSNDEVAGIVFMGDWNSMPSNTRKIIQEPRQIISYYPTHINPNQKVSFYDHGYIYGLPSAKLLSVDNLSIYSQSLIRSINRSRYQYLKQNK